MRDETPTRCFLALYPDAASRAALCACTEGIAQGPRRLPPDSLHLTLAFLGDRSDAEVAGFRAALADVEFTGLAGEVLAWCWLPEPQRARVGALRIGSGGRIDAFAAALRERLAVGPDDRFLPHVSLLRLRAGSRPVVGDPAGLVVRFDRCGLYASELGPDRARYRPLLEIGA